MTTRAAIIRYIIIAYAWTWVCWIGAWALAKSQSIDLQTDMTLFGLFSTDSSAKLLVQALFAAGVFGPLIAYIAMRRYVPFWGKLRTRYMAMVLLVPMLLITPALVMSLASGMKFNDITIGAFSASVALYFVSNLLTSGTEEFGWRGFLYPAMRRDGKSFWDVSLKSGLLWAVWHYPLLIILYASMGFLAVTMIIGFTASIVAMSYITNFIYERTGSLALAVILHALNNTSSFIVVLLLGQTPFMFTIALVAWAIVAVIEKRSNIEQKFKQTTAH